MRFWVTGASGMLGKEVCAVLRTRELNFVATDRTLDITNAEAVEQFAAQEPFTHLVNCAAYTGVDACEADEKTAMCANADGPANLARVARACGAIAVHVSTDYVFPGTKGVPYEEDDPTGPINAYGRTKLAGETRFRAMLEKAYVVRTSWLFGDGPNFVATMLRLFAERPEVRVVDDQIGRPTHALDLASMLVELAVKQPAPGTYHFANTGQTTWYGLAAAARNEARARGWKADAAIAKILTADYPTPATRPAYSVLSTAKVERELGIIPRSWGEALAAYFDRLAPS